MTDIIASTDWTQSPLGPPEQWSDLLASTLRLVLPAKAQIVLFWGPHYVALYNAACAPSIGDKHPQAFGHPATEHWAELWDDLEPLLRTVREEARTIHANEDTHIDLLFTDVVLPGGMTGAMVAQQARSMRPGLKILFTTGYARDTIVHHGRLDPASR